MTIECSCIMVDVTSFGDSQKQLAWTPDPACPRHGEALPVDDFEDQRSILAELRDPATGMLRFAERGPVKYCNECLQPLSDSGLGPHLRGCAMQRLPGQRPLR